MTNITTIDFDIMMAPSIQMYNNMTDIPWENRRNISPHFNLLTLDGVHYQKITSYILGLTKALKAEQIVIIENHEQILDVIPTDDRIALTNIDHHHDIEYDSDTDDKITSGNWVKQLYLRNQCQSYFWIRNGNSSMPVEKNEHYLTSHIDLREYDLNKLMPPDVLVLCLSQPWVPPEYQPLFFTWLDMLNRIYDTHFDFRK